MQVKKCVPNNTANLWLFFLAELKLSAKFIVLRMTVTFSPLHSSFLTRNQLVFLAYFLLHQSISEKLVNK